MKAPHTILIGSLVFLFVNCTDSRKEMILDYIAKEKTGDAPPLKLESLEDIGTTTGNEAVEAYKEMFSKMFPSSDGYIENLMDTTKWVIEARKSSGEIFGNKVKVTFSTQDFRGTAHSISVIYIFTLDNKKIVTAIL